ncbi:MAG TPA: MarR family transcriptional regulator [Micromonosporaceae bacterium]|nr:MarR family transcriptional regulator [Micromonosporaceae bacterium]
MTDVLDRVSALRVLARLSRVLEAVDSGLTLPQYRVLAVISHGGVRSARLAERLAVRRPTLTAIADGLVAAGYAARESDPGDRRVVRLHVTEAGREALRRADEAYLERLSPILDETGLGDRIVAELLAVGDVLDERLRQKVATVPEDSATTPADESMAATA